MDLYFKKDLQKTASFILLTTLLFYVPLLLLGILPELFGANNILERGGIWTVISFLVGLLLFLSFAAGLTFIVPRGGRRFYTYKFHIGSLFSKGAFFIFIEGMYGFTYDSNPYLLIGLFFISLLFDFVAYGLANHLKEEDIRKKIVYKNRLLSDGRLIQYKKALPYSLGLGIIVLLLSFRHQVDDYPAIFYLGILYMFSFMMYRRIFKIMRVGKVKNILYYTYTLILAIIVTAFRYYTSISVLESTSLLLLMNFTIYLPVLLPLIWMYFRVIWHYDYAYAKGLITIPLF